MGASGVLIVEDDVAIQGLLAAFFREEGYTVFVASAASLPWSRCAPILRVWSCCSI